MKLRLLILGLFLLNFQGVAADVCDGLEVINQSKHTFKGAWLDVQGKTTGIHLYPGWNPNAYLQTKDKLTSIVYRECKSGPYNKHFTLAFDNEQHEYYFSDSDLDTVDKLTVNLYDDKVVATVKGTKRAIQDNDSLYEKRWVSGGGTYVFTLGGKVDHVLN